MLVLGLALHASMKRRRYTQTVTITDSLPNAAIYVYDNNSRDDTAAVARQAGATVLRETR